VIVGQLDQSSEELCSLFITKANDESKLPTVGEALKNTNSCLESALSSLCQCSSALRRQIYNNLPKIGLLLTSELKENEENILEPSTEQDNDECKESNEIQEIMHESPIPDTDQQDMMNNLKVNLDSMNEKLKKSEQAKEHWKLECQLLQMKLSKLKGEETNAGDNNEENLIENHIKTKIDELISEKLFADSKATHLYLECLALQKRLQYWEKCKNKAQEALKSAQNDIKDLKDDAKTTSLNYEDQLSLMSEHLANMNDRLTNQTDEIERLKYELSNKKSGKR